MPKPITLLIADDHALLRSGLRRLLTDQKDFKVIGEAATGPETIEKAIALEPDILLLDIAMPQSNVVQTIKTLHAKIPAIKVLVLTMHEDYFHLDQTLRAGALGFICKDAADSDLCSAVRMVNDGHIFIDIKLRSQGRLDPSETRSNSHFIPLTKKRLSNRETQVLGLVAQGHTNRSIGQLLQLSVKSVETYRARFIDKLDLTTRADIVRYALKNELM